ncbi:MAG: hypothetical protein ACLP36_05380 [Acidimicrobiales bacterium]
MSAIFGQLVLALRKLRRRTARANRYSILTAMIWSETAWLGVPQTALR